MGTKTKRSTSRNSKGRRKSATRVAIKAKTIPNSELKPIVKKILEENKDALKGLADK